MLRFVFICFFIIIFLILSIPILIIEYLIGMYNKDIRNISCLYIIQNVFKFIIKLTGCKIHIINKKNIFINDTVLYISNHQSVFDVIITYTLCKNLTGYIAKKEIKLIPILSIWMKYLNCIFVNRTSIKSGAKAILSAINKIKNRISIFVFPEGTRNKNKYKISKFYNGSFKIAIRTNCKIVPIAILNSRNIFESHFPIIKPTNVIIKYGKPININKLSEKQKKYINNYIYKIIFKMLNECKKYE